MLGQAISEGNVRELVRRSQPVQVTAENFGQRVTAGSRVHRVCDRGLHRFVMLRKRAFGKIGSE